jgi:4-oxalocrotonate tautomerase
MPVIQVTISQGRSVEQKRELVKVLTRETAKIMKTDEEKVRILIYEVSKENWGNAGILGSDMYVVLNLSLYFGIFLFFYINQIYPCYHDYNSNYLMYAY